MLMLKYFNELDDKKNYKLELIKEGNKVLYVDDANMDYLRLKYIVELANFEKFVNMFRHLNNISDYIFDNYGDYEKNLLDNMIESYPDLLISYESALSEKLYFLCDITKLLQIIYESNKEYYTNLNVKYNKALEEYKQKSSIIYKVLSKKTSILSASWYITPNECLYNTLNTEHKYCDFNSVYESLKRIPKSFDIDVSKIIIDNPERYFNEGHEIIKKGYITKKQYQFYTNSSYEPPYLLNEEGEMVNHQKQVNDIIIGIVMANGYFNKFFSDMNKYCHNPREELNKLDKMVNGFLPDILVRCCGFYKIDSRPYKTITTSDDNYEYTLKKYIEAGWHIDFRAPIVINREMGILDEKNHDEIKNKIMHYHLSD